MYDPRSEPREFVGAERAEAVASACEFFGVAEEELAITDLRAGEVYGAASRVVLVAVPRERRAAARERWRPEGSGRRGAEARERGGRAGPRPKPPPPSGPSVGAVQGTLGEIGEFLCGVIERMGLGPFEISESPEGGLLVFQVGGAAARLLAGGDGRPVDALQLLANQAASRLSEDPPRVVLDVEGDAEARESWLTKLAQRVARRARDTGRPVRLDPMNGRDRRVIHLTLRDEADVATVSTGEGRYRQVVVVPEGAPEYEQAVRESEAAAERSG